MEIKTKILVTAIILGVAFSPVVLADPIVELAAPRIQIPKIIPDDGGPIKSVVTSETAPITKDKKQLESKNTKNSKKIRRNIKKRPVIKVDYKKVSKLIEYGYYDYADKILEGAINRNAKDINAKALHVIALAKQSKLNPAQEELDNLLKQYPKNSDLHYAQGIIYYQRTTSSNMIYRNHFQKLLNDALNEFKKAVDLDKNNAKAYNAAGVISIQLNNTKDAISYFQKAVSIDKNYSMAIDNLGTIDFANSKFKDAEAKFKQALVFNTQNTTAMYHLAQVAMQKQDYATALNYLNDALAIESNSPAIYNLMGKAYVAQGNEAAAINSFRQSITVKPEFTLSYLDLADIYQKRCDSEFAIEQLKTALTIEPDLYDAKLKIADISLENGKYKQAIDVYSELVGLDNYNTPALKGLAFSYYTQAQIYSNKTFIGSNKDLFKALDCINKAIEADNKAGIQDLELHLAKLKLSKITNQPDLAKVVLDKIVKSPANDLTSTVIKGEAYLTLNDYQNAQKTFESAIKLSQNTDDDLYLAEIFIYHKQFACAEQVLQKILKTDSQNKEALSDLDYIQKNKKYADNYFKSGRYFLKSGNLTTAAEYLSRSLAMNPNNSQAHLLLGQLNEKTKNYADAVINYKAYLGLEPNSPNVNKIRKKIRSLDNKL